MKIQIHGLFVRLTNLFKETCEYEESDARRITALMHTILEQAETVEQRLKDSKKKNSELLKQKKELNAAKAKAIRDLKQKHSVEMLCLSDANRNNVEITDDVVAKNKELYQAYSELKGQYLQQKSEHSEAMKKLQAAHAIAVRFMQMKDAEIGKLRTEIAASKQRAKDESDEYLKKALELSKKLADAQGKIPHKPNPLMRALRDQMRPGK